jgi:hypothetical protein
MLPDNTVIEARYKEFIEKVAATKLVWGLKDKQGLANTYSHDDEQVDVIPFWSDKAYAKTCARDEWKKYLPVAIPVAEFLESWCVEMAENGTLAGVNWDVNMYGTEAEALALALDILKQLNDTGADMKFSDYESISDFIAEIEAAGE